MGSIPVRVTKKRKQDKCPAFSFFVPRQSSNTARTRTACIVLWVRNIAPPSPAETLQGGANSRTKPRRLDAREVLVTAGQMSCFLFLNVLYICRRGRRPRRPE